MNDKFHLELLTMLSKVELEAGGALPTGLLYASYGGLL